MNTISPIQIDFTNSRKERQKYNNTHIYNIIKSGDISKLQKECNGKELQRILEDLQISIDELICECNSNELLAKMTSRQCIRRSTYIYRLGFSIW